jgi:pyruvate/2-oxoglutarate dehydrogenase complex dihydrolipoamide dehydrogenase (E3) component
MQFDVIVIGTGQAGVPLATRLTAAGKRVLIVERSALGGTCVNYGCTPTKTMLASARAAHVARHAKRLGVHTGEVKVDLPALVDRKAQIVSQWRNGVRRRLQDAGERLSLIEAEARFVGQRQIEVDGDRHQSDVVVVNVGARPTVPKIPGLERAPFLDSTSIMAVRELPRHLIVLGGGYIGCEFAQMFRRFGSVVTVVDMAPHLMAMEEPEASETLEEVFRSEGLELRLGVTVEEVYWDGADVVVRLKDEPVVRGSHLLVATGRRPNTDDLGCDAADIRLDARGFILVDDDYRTSAEGVYALGDCTPGPQFTHASWDDHRLLFNVLMGQASRRRNERLVPITAFTDPPLARVGITEREAKEKALRYEAATMPFGNIARAIEADEKAGTMKVLLEPDNEHILGATIVGAEAGELIHVFVALMQAGAKAQAIVDMEAVHPTYAEGVQSLVMRLRRYAL